MILYTVVAVGLRVMGKRQVGELEPMELVVTILIGELIAIPMQDLSVPLLAGFVPVLTILVVSMLVSYVMTKSIKLRKIVVGNPSILVHDGRVDRRQLKKNNINTNELIESLRLKNVTDLAMVQYAILETNGQMSVMLYADQRPPTASELSGQKAGAGLPVIVISDGRWQDGNLQTLGLSRGWVVEQARLRGVTGGVKDIFLMTVDEQKNIFLQAFDEAVTA
ncbi:MAG: DUF421 domain-containing protein [Oscillospiraceae bacterium]|nr:DUF421 domain-containing protein [Oscillospiraceae bacterium]